MNVSPRRIAQQVAGLWMHSGKVDWDHLGLHSTGRAPSASWKRVIRRNKKRANRILDRMSAL